MRGRKGDGTVREGERWGSTATELATYSRRIVKTAAWGHDLHRSQNLWLPRWVERVIPHALARVWSTYMTHEIQSLFPLRRLWMYIITPSAELWPVSIVRGQCCAVFWASNPCCRYSFKMHMQWITSLPFDRMINYLQRCCKILPSIEWLISSCVLNLAEMYEFRGSNLKLNLHLLPALSVAVCVWGFWWCVGC